MMGLKKFLSENPDPCNVKEKGLQKFTWEEIAKHNTVEDAWTVYEDRVYDITLYLKYHTGGINSLKPVLGKKSDDIFKKCHGYLSIDNFIKPFQIGTVA